MKKTTLTFALAVLGTLGATTAALAQYTGPTQAASSGYTGPSSILLMTAKQVTETGKDDQHVRIVGRLVSHDGGKHYTFADDTGRLSVEISDKHFPAGQLVNADQRIELVGEIDKGFNKLEFEVDQLRVIR